MIESPNPFKQIFNLINNTLQILWCFAKLQVICVHPYNHLISVESWNSLYQLTNLRLRNKFTITTIAIPIIFKIIVLIIITDKFDILGKHRLKLFTTRYNLLIALSWIVVHLLAIMLTINILIYHTFYNCYQLISSFFLRWYVKRVALLIYRLLPLFYFRLSSAIPYNILLYRWLCGRCSNRWCHLLAYNFCNFFNLLAVNTLLLLLAVFLRLFGLLNINFNLNFIFNNFVWLISHMFIVIRDVQEKSTFLHESEIKCIVVRNDVIAIIIFTSMLSKLIYH